MLSQNANEELRALESLRGDSADSSLTGSAAQPSHCEAGVRCVGVSVSLK